MVSASSPIVVVGSINLDLVAQVTQLPRRGETVTASNFRRFPGGKGANQAVAVARLGGIAQMIACVGDDPCGLESMASLQSSGVDISWIKTVSNYPTGVAMITVDSRGENCITIVEGANAQLSPADVWQHEGVIAAAGALLVQLEAPLETVVAAVEIARRHKVLTVLDPAPAPAGRLPRELEQVDLITPNQTETERILGLRVDSLQDAVRAAQQLLSRGAGRVLVTLGPHGALACDPLGCPGVPSRVGPADRVSHRYNCGWRRLCRCSNNENRSRPIARRSGKICLCGGRRRDDPVRCSDGVADLRRSRGITPHQSTSRSRA